MAKKTVPLGTCRGGCWFCESVKTGAEQVLPRKVLLQERRIAGTAKGGNRLNSSSENRSFKAVHAIYFYSQYIIATIPC